MAPMIFAMLGGLSLLGALELAQRGGAERHWNHQWRHYRRWAIALMVLAWMLTGLAGVGLALSAVGF